MNAGRFASTITRARLLGVLLGCGLLVGAFVLRVAAAFPSSGTGF